MRDPIRWSVPLFRLGPMTLRLHLLSLLVIPVLFRFLAVPEPAAPAVDLLLLIIVLPLPLLIVRELARSTTARMLNVVPVPSAIWPLGSMAAPADDLPGRAAAAIALSGPAANALLATLGLALLAGAGYRPPMSLMASPIATPCLHVATGTTATSGLGRAPVLPDADADAEPRRLPTWAVWVWRGTFFSVWLTVINLVIPALPFDAGHLVAAWCRRRSRDPVAAALAATRWSFLVIIPLIALYGLVQNESTLIVVAVIMVAASVRYLFSAAPAADEREREQERDTAQEPWREPPEDEPAPPPERRGWWSRWKQQRAEKREALAREQRQHDEDRVDALLDKIQQSGSASLTAEERAFLDRMSTRYRNRL